MPDYPTYVSGSEKYAVRHTNARRAVSKLVLKRIGETDEGKVTDFLHRMFIRQQYAREMIVDGVPQTFQLLDCMPYNYNQWQMKQDPLLKNVRIPLIYGLHRDLNIYPKPLAEHEENVMRRVRCDMNFPADNYSMAAGMVMLGEMIASKGVTTDGPL